MNEEVQKLIEEMQQTQCSQASILKCPKCSKYAERLQIILDGGKGEDHENH